MTLPMNFTLVRHGLSEANRIQKFLKSQDMEGLRSAVNIQEVINRHDSTARLAVRGVEQAQITGDWIRENLDPFDHFYVSPHIRTCETASHLKLGGEWVKDDRFREREWGEVANTNEDFSDPMSEISRKLKHMNEWYWSPQGGESLAANVRNRVELVMQSIRRRGDRNSNVVAVTHGEFIAVTRFVIERMSPDVFNIQDSNPAYKIENTMVIEYTRRNPHRLTEVEDEYRWRRATCPWDESLSWSGGDWVEFETKKHTDDELLSFAEAHPRFFSDDFAS